MIFRRSANVPQFNDHRLYRDSYLRPDFQYRCAYCLTHEFYFLQGDGGEIDHHRLLRAANHDFSYLKNAYGNLYWVCSQCNREKGNLWPTDAEYIAGLRFLDPCVDDHDDHWNTLPDGTVTAKTAIGRYTILNIRLNRKRLSDLRHLLHSYQQKITDIENELKKRILNPEHRAALLGHLADIRTLVNPPVFNA